MSKINRKKLLNPLFATDSYKHSHHAFVPDGTSLLYSHLTPRGNKRFLNNYPDHDDKIVVYGIRYLIEELQYRWKKGFFDRKWKKIEKESLQVLGHHLGFTETDLVKFKKLHELGYLPLQIKAIKEGSLVNTGVPILTVVNTLPEYFWLTNFIESYILNTLCPAMTAATITREFAKLRDQYFDMTVEDQTYKGFHLHNFSYRGCHGHEVAGLIGSAHNLFTLGTDTLYGIAIAQEYYGAGEVAYSVNAGEHSVVTLGINYYDNEDKLNGEYLNLRSLLTEKYPTGILSYIADSYDFWRVIDTILPNLKKEIMTREGKLVIRPDCYSSDTQVLTPYGFKLFSQLQEDDLVAQVLDNGTYEFVKPLKIVNEPYKGKMYHFKDQHGKVDQVVTPNHRMIYKQINPTNNLIITEKVKFAEDMKTSGNYLNYFERSAKAQNQNKSLTLLERLNIAFQADGSYVTNSNNSIRFSFSKQRKIDRLSSLLTEANIPFKTYQLASGNTEFNISLDKNLVSKDFNWINVSNLCSNWCEEFLEELKHWDSSVRSSSRFKYDTTNKTCSDIVELIALSAGKGVLTTESEDNREAHFSNIFTSNILDSNRCGGQSWIKEEIDYDGTVHCVQIPTGRLIVKRNRSIMVCGNSGEPIYNLCGYRVIETPEVYSIEKAIEYAALNNAEVVKTDGRFYLIEPQINTPTTHKEISEAEALGLVETLWNTFGGTTNTKGYRQLDSHIGIIYGDGLSYHKVKLIYQLLSAKGFAVDNVILAQGAYTMSTLNDRDQFNVAIKASAAIVNGDIVPVFKDPATDHGKKSVKGFLKVTKDEKGKFTVHEDVTEEEELTGELEVVLYDGTIYNSNVTYEQIKEIVNS